MLMVKIFNTTQSDLLKYNGTMVVVLGALEESKYDKEDVGQMYRIRFYDSVESDAFADELIDPEDVCNVEQECSACGERFWVQYRADGSYVYLDEPCCCEASYAPVSGYPSLSEWLDSRKGNS